ncbi:MAG: hypothetical protein Q4A79_03060 [Candidatus Saccharibacteria bacterium]|nr:hypothetical protein [Candidatus Saccharibacteria bacterium]
MNNKSFFNDEEIKCLKKFFVLASITKYTLVAIFINIIPLVFMVIDDFIRFENNVPRSALNIFLFSNIAVLVILLIFWAVFYIILKRNLSRNKIWQTILKRIDSEEDINAEVGSLDSSVKALIPSYLLGDLISMSEDTKEIGDTIKTINGITMMVLIIKACSVLIRFIREASKKYNFTLKPTCKIFFVLFIMPAFVITILDVSTTAIDVNNGSKTGNNVFETLKENCKKESYCINITRFGDQITVELEKKPYTYSNLKLDENKKIKSIVTALSYNKNIPKDEIISDANKKIKQVTSLINASNLDCTYDFICQDYQLSDEFINKFYNLSDTDIEGRDTRYESELGNKYSITTHSYIQGDQNSEPTDTLYIVLSIDK